MLYIIVEDALLESGLDVYLGLIHAIKKKNKALVYDLIEPYRPWVDETVVMMIRAEVIRPQDFFFQGKAMRITSGLKKILITQWHQLMSENIRWEGKSRSRKNHIYLKAAQLGKIISKYKP